MAKYQRISRGKKIKPTYFVFCEGESEDAYISFLRSHYRVSIQIITKVLRNKINKASVKRILSHYPVDSKDKIYLLYDIDIPGMLDKILAIEDAELLVSNPCFEIWYILHYCNQNSEISTPQCIKKIESLCKNYSKGSICEKLKGKLTSDMKKARERAKRLTSHQNPSTSVYLLLDELDKSST